MFRKKHFSNLCSTELKKTYTNSEILLTHSATGALEIIANLIDIQPKDEIIMPSFTFVSTASAFVNRGATPVFVDIKKDTLNIDETLLEQAITPKTKAIIAMHYAGHSCNLSAIKHLCSKYNLYLIEDAAMAYGMLYEGKPLGSVGDFGVVSFDITKHVTAIQGGMLLINNTKYIEKAHQVYHIGTNRKAFELGEVDHYEWVDYGSKFQMNELNAAYLYHEIINAENVLNHRKKLSKLYYSELIELSKAHNFVMLGESLLESNVHEFYLVVESQLIRNKLIKFLEEKNIEALFHYQPLHTSELGKKIGRYIGEHNTELIAQTIIRLPLNNLTTEDEVKEVSKQVKAFYQLCKS